MNQPATRTSVQSLRNAPPAQTAAPAAKGRSLAQIMELPRDRQFPAMLESFSKEIALALPKHINPERMARLALTAFKQSPQLAKCSPSSVFACVILASQLGLELGVDGEAYMIPYGTEATFVAGWKGYVKLISNANQASIWTGAVFAGDQFDYALGDSPHITHRPMGESDETEANLTHVYCVGRVHGAHWPILEVWPVSRVRRHRDKFNKVGRKHYSYSNDASFIAYGRKVALLQVQKYLPKSVELRVAEAAEGRSGEGFNLKSVLEGEWSTVETTLLEDNADRVGADDAPDHNPQGNDSGAAGAETSPEAGQATAASESTAATAEDAPPPTARARRSTAPLI